MARPGGRGSGASVEALDPVVPLARIEATVESARRGWLRERSSTPARLGLIAALLVVGAVCFGVVATIAERSLVRGAEGVRTQAEPRLVRAGVLYTALSDANATEARAFLRGGLEPRSSRGRYLADLLKASSSPGTLAVPTGAATAARSAVTTLGEELPIYAGLIETARANNREGLPVGAAYLRKASALLGSTILPAARDLYANEAQRLTADYSSGTATWPLIVLAALAAGALILLILAQRYVSRISRRVFNVPMLLATLVLVGLGAWTVIGVVREHTALTSARRDSDAVEVMSATRILLSRAQSDESLTLVSRGSDQTDPVDLARVERELSRPSGLIAETAAIDAQLGARAAGVQLRRDYASFVSAPSSAAIAARLDHNLDAQIVAAQSRFTTAAGDATTAVSGLSVGIPALATLACLLALLGVWQRLEEYR